MAHSKGQQALTSRILNLDAFGVDWDRNSPKSLAIPACFAGSVTVMSDFHLLSFFLAFDILLTI